jgi:hypothetical protein
MAVAPCKPVTSPAREPEKLVALVALPARLAVIVPAEIFAAVIAVNPAPFPASVLVVLVAFRMPEKVFVPVPVML